MAETPGGQTAVATDEHPDAYLPEAFADEAFGDYYARQGVGPTAGPAQRTGRRKEAVARVRLVLGSGEWKINERSLEDYFPNKVHQQIVREPLRIVDALERFDVVARLHGGGVSGQAGALRLGVARALTEVDLQFRPALKKAGFLTRDARVKERRKYGLKKARKAPQYSKR